MLLLFVLVSAFARGDIMSDLDACVDQPALRPRLEQVFSGDTQARIAVEAVHWSKARCVRDVMTDYLGAGADGQSLRLDPAARLALVRAHLYYGLKLAELHRTTCLRHPPTECGRDGFMAEVQRGKTLEALRDVLDDLAMLGPESTIAGCNRERLDAIARKMRELETRL